MHKIPKETDDEKKFRSALDNFNKDILGLIENENIDKKNNKFIKTYELNKITDEFIQKKLRPFIRNDIPTINLNESNFSKTTLKGLFERIDAVKATTFIELASTLKQSTDNLSKDINNYIKSNSKLKYGDIHEYLKGKLERENGLTIEYKNGAKIPIEKYVDMVTRSARIETANVGMINETLSAGGDLVKCSTVTPTCDLCAKYQGRVYSISGKDKRFPSLFETAFKSGYAMIHPNCRHEFFPYIEEFESEKQVKEDVENSNRNWDENSKANQLQSERDLYAKGQAQLRQFNSELLEFKRMKEYYSQIAKPPPYSTIGAFRRARRAETEQYDLLHKELLTYERNNAKIKAFQEDFKNNNINLKVKKQKQNEHIPNTKERQRRIEKDNKYLRHSSEFFPKVDIDNVIKNYQGSGVLDFATNRKYPYEYVTTNSFVGQSWSVRQNKYIKTKRICIVYGKDGVHAFPVLDKGEKDV